MPKRLKITEKDHQDIIKMYRNKIKIAVIASKYHVVSNTIIKLLHRLGEEVTRPKSLTEEVEKYLKENYIDNVTSIKELAVKFKAREYTVCCWLQQLGLTNKYSHWQKFDNKTNEKFFNTKDITQYTAI